MDNSTSSDLDIPPHVLSILQEFLLGIRNPQLDFREPHIRSSVANFLPFIIFMYVLLIGVGLSSNLAVLIHILKNKLYSDPLVFFIINNAFSDIVKCIIILPISLYVLLIQNWMLGEFLCSFLPMLQDIPMHATTLTFLLIAWDRYRLMRHPTKPRAPAFVCTIGTWLTSICLVLPYPIYIMYVDLGKYLHHNTFEGVGLCIVNLVDDMKEYMRGIFLVMYAGPLATISYLFVRTSREIMRHSPTVVMLFEARNSGKEGRSRTDSHSTTDFPSSTDDFDHSSQFNRSSFRDENSRGRCEVHELEIDVVKEKRTQKYLVAMVTMYAMCLCPLMFLRLVRLALVETYENSENFDITYTMFVWIAFLPTCSTPLLFAAWQMSRSSKDRLRGYFRFSNRKLRQSCETVVTAAGTPAIKRTKCNYHEPAVQQVEDGLADINSLQQDFNSS